MKRFGFFTGGDGGRGFLSPGTLQEIWFGQGFDSPESSLRQVQSDKKLVEMCDNEIASQARNDRKWCFSRSFFTLSGLVCLFILSWEIAVGQSNTSLGNGAYSNTQDKYRIERIDVTNQGTYQFPVVDMGGVQGTWDYSSLYIYDSGIDFYGYFKTTSNVVNPTITGGHGSGATLYYYMDYYDDVSGMYYYEVYTDSYGNGYGPDITITGGDGQAAVSYYQLYPNGELYIKANTIIPYTIAPQVNISFGGAIAVAVLSGTAANGNHTAIGYQALAANTTGNANTAVGYQALLNGTVGSYNTILGYQSGTNLTTGNRNTFVGNTAGRGITTGYGNTIIGNTLSNLAANLYNTVILADGNGSSRFFSNSNGNAFLGYGNNPTDNGYKLDVNGEIRATSGLFQAARFLGASQGNPNKQLFRISAYQPLSENLYFVRPIPLSSGYPVDLEWSYTSGEFDFKRNPTVNGNGIWHTGNFNPLTKADTDGNNINQTAFRAALGLGISAFSNNSIRTVGFENMAIGNGVLDLNTGIENVGIGERALKDNTTGTENTAVGVNALMTNTIGSGNTVLGNYTMYHITAGNENTAVGKNALEFLTTGNKNIGIGISAGNRITTGSNNIFLGSRAGRGITTGSNNVIIGSWSPEIFIPNTSNNIILADGEGNIRMQFKENGNLGVGTAPDNNHRVVINGNIKAKAVKVDPNAWPDYVFETGYHLPSLTETEEFIKENKHLPGVPSAREVENKGVDLGDMSAVLLKKIEELTLHLIQKDKELAEANRRIDMLIQKIEKE